MINDLGVDPYDWFDRPHPHDSMPIATNDRFDMYGSSDADYAYVKAQVEKKDPPAELLEVPTSVTNPRPEEEIADWFMEQPDESDEIEKDKSMHHKAYEIATSRYNPFSVGGSENCDSDLDCNIKKHSPWPGGSEAMQK